MKKIFLLLFGILVAAASAVAQTPSFKVAKSGKGQPIIFLPGFTCPGSVWDETIAHLKKKNELHVISYAGFNGITPIKMPWYETIKSEMIAYIRKEKLSHVRIVGHSMGGMLALDIAAELPDQVYSIVAVDAIPCMRELMMPNVPASAFKYDSPYNKQQLAASDSVRGAFASMMASGMTNNKQKIESLKSWMMEADRETYIYGYTDLLKIDLRESLTRIKAKTLVIGASFPDVKTVTANFDKQYANLQTKTIVIAENSRHFVMFDQPEWFYDKLNAFLAE
jgi:pimeloyl-ACP methyl ester carboxylesterase